MKEVCRVNMKTKEVSFEPLKEEYKRFGQRGLIAKILTDEVDPKCDPLGPENKLLICTGVFSGTTLTTANRISVGGKSPLTGGIKEANSGGNTGFMMAGHGLKALLFEDVPEEGGLYLLHVDKASNVNLIPADEYRGMNTYDFVSKMYERFGKDCAVTCIGAAGEKKYLMASVQHTDATTGFPSRASARGGLGALAGSKGLKGIVFEKPVKRAEISFADQERFRAAAKAYTKIILESNKIDMISKEGTPFLVDVAASMGVLPVKNFRGEVPDPEKLAQLGLATFKKNLSDRKGRHGVSCQPGCLVQCSCVYTDQDGNYITGGLEYETIALCGSNLEIWDYDIVAKIDKMCDDMGVDTIEMGATLGVAMEAGLIPWGNGEKVLEAMQAMIDGVGIGPDLGLATQRLGEKYNVKRIPACKSQALAGYDPRGLKGTGITYSTSTMGGDHTAGITIMKPIVPTAVEGQIEASIEAQTENCLGDNFMCSFAFWPLFGNHELFTELMAGKLGGEWRFDQIMAIGHETMRMERAFNKNAGFTKENDRLPEFFYTEVALASKQVFDVPTEVISAGWDQYDKNQE